MNNDFKRALIAGLIMSIFIVIIGIIGGCMASRIKESEIVEDGGVVRNGRVKGFNEKIKSEDIVYFSYAGSGFEVSSELKDNKLHILSTGNDFNERDGSFSLEYITTDLSFLKKLQEIVKKYSISLNNGYEYEVAGLPEGYGDIIKVTYKSGERIYKYSNQSNTIKEEAIDAIYNAFKDLAKENGYKYTNEEE